VTRFKQPAASKSTVCADFWLHLKGGKKLQASYADRAFGNRKIALSMQHAPALSRVVPQMHAELSSGKNTYLDMRAN
jgi:hypothetical protein